MKRIPFRLEDTQEYQDLLRQQEVEQSRTPASAIAQALRAKNVGPVAVDPAAKAQREYDYAAQPPEVIQQGIAMLPESVQPVAEFFAPSRADLLTMGATKLGSLAAKATGLAKPAQGMVRELITYHGTPHTFPAVPDNPLGAFDASKIGTGEGAQAYGHGIYYAENPEVAKGYQPRDPKAEAKLMNLYKQAEARQNYDAMEVLEAAMLHRTASELAEQFPQQKALINRIGKINEKAAGALYTADLPDEMIDRMLDWDAPLSKQPKEIVGRLTPENLGLTYVQFPNGNHAFVNASGERLGNVQRGGSPESFRQDWINELLKRTGRDLYNQLGQGTGKNKAASEALRNAGIPGIKYLDAGSHVEGGSKTRNFVVFPGEESNVKILKRE